MKNNSSSLVQLLSQSGVHYFSTFARLSSNKGVSLSGGPFLLHLYTYLIETVCNILSVKKYLQKNYILARLTKTMFKGYIFDKHSTTSQAPPPNLNTNEIPDSPYQTVYIMSQNKFHAILF